MFIQESFPKLLHTIKILPKNMLCLHLNKNLTNANSEVCMNCEFENEMLTFLNSLNRFSVTELQELIDAFVWYTHVAITFVTF